jgi:hypothetical protein
MGQQDKVDSAKGNETPTELVIKLIFRGLIPIVLLVCGVVLFVSRAAIWNVILGLPLIVFGVTTLIYTYDEVISKKVDASQPKFVIFESKYVRCFACGKKIRRVPGEWEEDAICRGCRLLKERERGKRKRKKRESFSAVFRKNL